MKKRGVFTSRAYCEADVYFKRNCGICFQLKGYLFYSSSSITSVHFQAW